MPLSLLLGYDFDETWRRTLLLVSRALFFIGVRGISIREIPEMVGAFTVEALALMVLGWTFGRSIMYVHYISLFDSMVFRYYQSIVEFGLCIGLLSFPLGFNPSKSVF